MGPANQWRINQTVPLNASGLMTQPQPRHASWRLQQVGEYEAEGLVRLLVSAGDGRSLQDWWGSRCVTLRVHSAYCGQQTQVLNLSMGDVAPGGGGGGEVWHAADVLVRLVPGATPVTQQLGLGLVDRLKGSTDAAAGAAAYASERRLFRTKAGHCAASFARLQLLAFDADTAFPLPSGSFANASGRGNVTATALAQASPAGWFDLEDGEHNLTVWGDGYAPHAARVLVGRGQLVASHAVFLMPLDSRSRVVLRWDSHPADLDVYLVPVGALADDGAPVPWRWEPPTGPAQVPPTVRPGDPPYLWWGLGSAAADGCGCVEPDCGSSSCAIFDAEADDEAAVGRLDLLRDAYAHGSKDSTAGFALNPPEVVRLTSLRRGLYLVYVHAPGPGGGIGECEVDVWLGGEVAGTVSMVNVKTSWALAGYVQVTCPRPYPLNPQPSTGHVQVAGWCWSPALVCPIETTHQLVIEMTH